ncbi:MAG: alpha/beta hydrolase [Acholeplasmatales bacterium]|nr:MAG: alpha/beta hydrolase [Acholeplasmatales bacterium]
MEKKQCQLPSGETLAYLELGDQNNETLVLLHGNMSSGVHYSPVLPGLAKTFHVIAPDMRGFGDSTYHTPIESIADLAEDLEQFLQVQKIDAIHLAGWSAGGTVAMRFAADQPHRVKSLILIASGSYRGFPIFEKDANYQPIAGKQYTSKAAMAADPVQVVPVAMALEQNNTSLMKQIWAAAIYNAGLPEEADFKRFIAETMKQRNLIDIDWALMQFNMSKEHNGVSEGDGSIERITCPVLALYGAHDLAVTESMFTETVKVLPDVTTKVYQKAGHSPITDVPETMIEDMCDFIASER